MFVNDNLSHLTLIVEKQHFDNLSVGRFSVHNLEPFVTFAESCFIIMISDRTKIIYACLFMYHNLISPIEAAALKHNLKLGAFITPVVFSL